LELVLQNTAGDCSRLRPALEEFALRHSISTTSVLNAADLALEEAVTNIIDYAYDDPATHEIRVRFSIEGDKLCLEIEDDGRPFNPLAQPPVDISLPPEERSVGGLGIHLIRRFIDEVDYRRDAGRNVLRMRKALR
jgi:anti-sigma regulatory factor (Ser/Thr protein kinase)